MCCEGQDTRFLSRHKVPAGSKASTPQVVSAHEISCERMDVFEGESFELSFVLRAGCREREWLGVVWEIGSTLQKSVHGTQEYGTNIAFGNEAMRTNDTRGLNDLRTFMNRENENRNVRQSLADDSGCSKTAHYRH